MRGASPKPAPLALPSPLRRLVAAFVVRRAVRGAAALAAVFRPPPLPPLSAPVPSPSSASQPAAAPFLSSALSSLGRCSVLWVRCPVRPSCAASGAGRQSPFGQSRPMRPPRRPSVSLALSSECRRSVVGKPPTLRFSKVKKTKRSVKSAPCALLTQN